MEIRVNSDGTINRAYRPYIDREELDLFTPYDPNRGIVYGLYSRNRAPCQSWENNWYRYMRGTYNRNPYDRNLCQDGVLAGRCPASHCGCGRRK